MQSNIVLLLATLSIASALPSLLLQDEQGQQYHLTPVLSRQRRQEPQIFGGGFSNKGVQSGVVGLANPNGSGGSIGYNHAPGYGKDFSVNAMVPVWSRKHGLEESTINVGGGFDRHIGGWGGNRNTGKSFGVNFNHRF